MVSLCIHSISNIICGGYIFILYCYPFKVTGNFVTISKNIASFPYLTLICPLLTVHSLNGIINILSLTPPLYLFTSLTQIAPRTVGINMFYIAIFCNLARNKIIMRIKYCIFKSGGNIFMKLRVISYVV